MGWEFSLDDDVLLKVSGVTSACYALHLFATPRHAHDTYYQSVRGVNWAARRGRQYGQLHLLEGRLEPGASREPPPACVLQGAAGDVSHEHEVTARWFGYAVGGQSAMQLAAGCSKNSKAGGSWHAQCSPRGPLLAGLRS